MSNFDKQTLLQHIYSLLSEFDREIIQSVEFMDGEVVACDGKMRVTVDFAQWEDEPNTLGAEIFTTLHGLVEKPVSVFFEVDVIKVARPLERIAKEWIHHIAGLFLTFLNRRSTNGIFQFFVNDSIGFSQCEGFITPLRFEQDNLSEHQRDFLLAKNEDRELLETMNLRELCPCFIDFIDDDEWHFVEVGSANLKTHLYVGSSRIFELSNSIPRDSSSRRLLFDIHSSHYAIVRRNNSYVPQTEEEKIDAAIREFVTYCHRTTKADWTKTCLQNAGFDPDIAHDMLNFVKLAFGRLLMRNRVKLRWSETYVLVKKDGSYERHLPLDQVLIYRRALLIGECYQSSRHFERVFRQIAESSAEVDATSHLYFILEPRPKILYLETPVFCESGTLGVLYNKVRNEILNTNQSQFQDAIKPRKKWWQFWK